MLLIDSSLFVTCVQTPQPSEMEVESQVHLYGHTAEVTSLFVCKPYSILISVSKDGTCILWDLNRCATFLKKMEFLPRWREADLFAASHQAVLRSEPHGTQKSSDSGVRQRDHRGYRNGLRLRWVGPCQSG